MKYLTGSLTNIRNGFLFTVALLFAILLTISTNTYAKTNTTTSKTLKTLQTNSSTNSKIVSKNLGQVAEQSMRSSESPKIFTGFTDLKTQRLLVEKNHLSNYGLVDQIKEVSNSSQNLTIFTSQNLRTIEAKNLRSFYGKNTWKRGQQFSDANLQRNLTHFGKQLVKNYRTSLTENLNQSFTPLCKESEFGDTLVRCRKQKSNEQKLLPFLTNEPPTSALNLTARLSTLERLKPPLSDSINLNLANSPPRCMKAKLERQSQKNL